MSGRDRWSPWRARDVLLEAAKWLLLLGGVATLAGLALLGLGAALGLGVRIVIAAFRFGAGW